MLHEGGVILPTLFENDSIMFRLADTMTWVFRFITPPDLQLSITTMCEVQSGRMSWMNSFHELQYSGALDDMKHMTTARSPRCASAPTTLCNMPSHEFNKWSAFGAITHSVDVIGFICNLFQSFCKSGRLVSVLHCASSDDVSDTLGSSPTVSIAPVTASISASRIHISRILSVTSAMNVLQIVSLVPDSSFPHAGFMERNDFEFAMFCCGGSRYAVRHARNVFGSSVRVSDDCDCDDCDCVLPDSSSRALLVQVL